MQLTERDKVKHLLRRFGLGASELEVAYYGEHGLKGAIDRLLDFESVPETLPSIDEYLPDKGALKPQQVQGWWLNGMLTTQRPLQEKMTLFWHDHFATAYSKVTSGILMHGQNMIFRQHCIGDFKELLEYASKDPAMLYWLDGQTNVKGKPNENFAREVMELFTLGVGHYTEKDVQEGARALTGWQISRGTTRNGKAPQRASFLEAPRLHDTGTKTFLGKTGAFTGDDILEILCSQPQCAHFITKKIWEFFVYPNPEPGVIDRLATRFQGNYLNIKSLLRDIMASEEFYSAKAIRGIYKNPVDFCVATGRQLGLGTSITAAQEAREKQIATKQGNAAAKQVQLRRPATVALAVSTKAMGMELLNPPDVSGWDGGPDWISSATMVERIKWADRIFGAPLQVKGGANLYIRFNANTLFDSGDPSAAVDKLIEVFDAPVPAAKRAIMVEAAKDVAGDSFSADNANKVAQSISRLIFGSPEFQMA